MTTMRTFLMALMVMTGGYFLAAVWRWTRVREGSVEWALWPGQVLLSASMLVLFLPRLLWPTADAVQIGGMVACVALLAASVTITIRRRRKVGHAGR